VDTFDDLADQLPRSFLCQRPLASLIGCALQLHCHLHGLGLTRLARRFFQPFAIRIRETGIPKWRPGLSVPLCCVPDYTRHMS
jgi:hypothetical protein